MRRAHVGILLGAILSAQGCKSPSQIVLGFATDLSAPDALDKVAMRVLDRDGRVVLNQEWQLPGLLAADYSLPGSFALSSEGGGEPTVEVVLEGYQTRSNPLQPRVTRTSMLGFVSEDTLFFRMTLVERCMGMSCAEGTTCIEGKCRPVAVNSISLLPYRAGMEQKIECNSGSQLIDTGSKQALPVEGDGYCEPDQWCGEATCYRNQGQGLLWCSGPDDVCRGVDGYEGCVVTSCNDSLAACYGPDWRRGHFRGVCSDYADCRTACACDTACIARCDAGRAASCSACLGGPSGVDACLAAAASTCTSPACQPRTTPSGDMGGGDMGPGPASLAIPSGIYYVGCDPADPVHPDPDCASDAQPLHPVMLSSFHIDRLETTQKQYSFCIVAGACTPPETGFDPVATPDLPVVWVNWQQAQDYCKWAGMQAGKMGRLPTEAEWETAAHGSENMVSAGPIYPWGDNPPQSDCLLATSSLCMPSGVRPVGQHPDGKSHFGAEDMAGNVDEWLGDYYGTGEYAAQLDMGTAVNNPTGPATGLERVKRGGDFTMPTDPTSPSDLHQLSATTRFALDPITTSDQVGFRCVTIP